MNNNKNKEMAYKLLLTIIIIKNQENRIKKTQRIFQFNKGNTKNLS